MAPPARAAAVSGREPSCLPTHSLSAAALRERPQVRAAQEAGDRPASRWSPRSRPRLRTRQSLPWRRSMVALNRLGSTWSSSAWRSKSPIAFSSLSSSIDMMELYELQFVESRPFGKQFYSNQPALRATRPTADTLFPALLNSHPSPAIRPTPAPLFPPLSPPPLLPPSPPPPPPPRPPP